MRMEQTIGKCTPPTSSDMLPKTQTTVLTPVSGTTYQNTWGVQAVLYASALLTPSATAPYYLTVLGPFASSLNHVL